MLEAASLLSALDRADLRSVVRALVSDSEVGQEVTWWPAATRTANLAAGTVAYTDTPATFTAVIGPAEADEAKGIKAGDVQMLVSLAEVSPKVDDRVRIGTGPVLVVKAVEPDPMGDMSALVTVGRVP